MRISKRNELLNGGYGQIRIVFVDFFERRPKLGILNDSISKNASTAHDGPSRYLSGY